MAWQQDIGGVHLSVCKSQPQLPSCVYLAYFLTILAQPRRVSSQEFREKGDEAGHGDKRPGWSQEEWEGPNRQGYRGWKVQHSTTSPPRSKAVAYWEDKQLHFPDKRIGDIDTQRKDDIMPYQNERSRGQRKKYTSVDLELVPPQIPWPSHHGVKTVPGLLDILDTKRWRHPEDLSSRRCTSNQHKCFWPTSEMLWQPVDLSATCPAHSDLLACSPFGVFYLAFLVSNFGDSADRRYQEELREKGEFQGWEEGADEHYDFIVVGAGAAGAVVANRLTEVEDWKVLLLEAGPEQPDVTLAPSLAASLMGSNLDWAYKTQPNGKSCFAYPGQQCDWPRGRVLGGSSSINSMSYIRGNRYDYDTWAALGNKEWSYDKVLPYFKKAENNLEIAQLQLDRKYHSDVGPQYVERFPYIDHLAWALTEAYHQAGLPYTDFNGASQIGTNQAQSFVKNGARVSTNTAYIQPIRYNRKNLVVRPDSEAVKVLVENNRAYGVVYIREGKKHTVYARKEVVVCGGPINSPKLLILSGIGPKEHLKELNIPLVKDLPVGENLHDHITFNGMIIGFPNSTSTLVSEKETVHQVQQYFEQYPHSNPISGNGPVNTIAFLKTDPNLPAPDVQYQANSAFLDEIIRDPVGAGLWIWPSAFYNAIVPRVENLVPKSRGRLLLNVSDPNGPPLIYANYFDDPEDILPILKGVRFLLRIEDTDAFNRVGGFIDKTPLPGCTQHEWGTDGYFECLIRTYTSSPYHPVGTCKMGPDWDRGAVVDSRLRVLGVEGLRVVDSSIMPIVPRGNTNAPSIMVGEVGSDLIKDDYQRKCL